LSDKNVAIGPPLIPVLGKEPKSTNIPSSSTSYLVIWSVEFKYIYPSFPITGTLLEISGIS